MAVAQASIVSGNQQALLFIQSLFKPGVQNQGQSIKVEVKEKHEGIPFTIEVNGNTTGSFVLYRVITTAGEDLWQSWDTPEEVEISFRIMSLI